MLISVAKALREIRYYQSAAMADKLIIPQASFAKLVRQICHDIAYTAGLGPEIKQWERDGLVSLQLATEHILTLIFEMTYCSCITTFS